MLPQQRKRMSNGNKKRHFCRRLIYEHQLYLPYVFWGEDVWLFFLKLSISVAMATNQFHRFGQKCYVW